MPKLPSVLFIGNFIDAQRGSPAVSFAVADRLRHRGWCTRFTSARADRAGRFVEMLSTVWRARHAYDVALVDVFSGPAFCFAEAVASALSLLRKPFALALHGGRLPEFAARHPYRMRRLLRQANAVVAPSRFLQECLQDSYPAIQLIPNPIDIENCAYRQRHCLAPRLVWLRAYHSIYNLPMALAAIDRVREFRPEAHLTVIGPDKGDGTFAAAVAEVESRGLSGCVSLLGPVPKGEVPSYLDGGDIFLNTTAFDNTPVSVLEAMACGLCVISTNVGGIPYLLENEVDALLIDSGDLSGCVHSILRVLDDEALATSLSAHARAKAVACDWSRVLPQYERLFVGLRP